MTNKSALRGYAEMVDALLARWHQGTELHVTGGGAHNLHEVLRTYRPMVEEIERLRAIIADIVKDGGDDPNSDAYLGEAMLQRIGASDEPSEQRCEFVGMYDIQCGLKAGHEGKHKIFGPYGLGASRDASSVKSTVSRLPVPGATMTRLSDIADELIRQLRKQGMEKMQAVFDGMRLRIDPWPEQPPVDNDHVAEGCEKFDE